jgi:hypothetical protein
MAWKYSPPKSAREAWNYRKAPTDHDKELRTVAEDKIRERNETDLQTLLHLQGREVKSLESEKTWIDKERARDVQTMHTKEIAAINQRYDRLDHDLARRNNTFLAKMSRVFGGHKRQQARVDKLNRERNQTVADRTKQHVDREAQRQRSLTERDMRVDKDLVEAKQRHVVARDEFRQQRERGFELSVKQEMNRLRVRGPSMGM